VKLKNIYNFITYLKKIAIKKIGIKYEGKNNCKGSKILQKLSQNSRRKERRRRSKKEIGFDAKPETH
jgi:hypothetical protein